MGAHGMGAPWKPDLGLKTTSTTACSASSFLSWACLGPYTAARTLEESCVHLAEPSARFRRPRSHARPLFERGSVPSSAWRRAAAASVGERTVIGPAAGLEPSQAIKTMGRRQACPLSQSLELTLVNGPVCAGAMAMAANRRSRSTEGMRVTLETAACCLRLGHTGDKPDACTSCSTTI